MILADTNIFLEILLNQKGKERCKTFLSKNLGNVVMSDFSLHSIGIILFSKEYHDIFDGFVQDIFPKIEICSLSPQFYSTIGAVAVSTGLDFDDAYQYCLSNEGMFEIATMDNDFKKVADRITIHFI